MKKEPLLYGIIGLLLGIVIAWSVSVYATNGNHNGMMRTMGMGRHLDDMMTSHPHASEQCNSGQCTLSQ